MNKPKTVKPRKVNCQDSPRADRLRELNLPHGVEVKLDDAGLPILVSTPCPSASLPPCIDSKNEPSDDTIGCTTPEDRYAAGKPVETIIETWRVDDEWWRKPISRRYVEVILEGGKHVVLYEDLNTNDWFVQMP